MNQANHISLHKAIRKNVFTQQEFYFLTPLLERPLEENLILSSDIFKTSKRGKVGFNAFYINPLISILS